MLPAIYILKKCFRALKFGMLIGDDSSQPSLYQYSMPALVAQLDASSDWRPGGRGFSRIDSNQIMQKHYYSILQAPYVLDIC